MACPFLQPDGSYFHTPSYILSRLAFIGTHLQFAYTLNFLFNDPFGFGLNTLDTKTPVPASTCAPIIWDNVLHNCLVLSIFFVQHFIMARRRYKEALGMWGTKSPLFAVERPIFACASVVAWFLSVALWRPVSTCTGWSLFTVPTYAWVVSGPVLLAATVFILGLLYSLPNHVFGTDRYHFAPGTYPALGDLIVTHPYNLVRHPAASGFLWLFWAVPAYTPGHILFAVLWTAFIVEGTLINEEGGLRGPHEFGRQYDEYARHVWAFVPSPMCLARAVGLAPPLVIKKNQ
eukprot:TRINITY_DN992_c0_g1_i1.p1 TRINITY_DN992_c0_g1~~TRINITY_DN992_c0_g1_i1.p1  ORF type:complete len:289 (+),score=28.58 TRINITY_DN992_c0_g1_i1:50-916(+)